LDHRELFADSLNFLCHGVLHTLCETGRAHALTLAQKSSIFDISMLRFGLTQSINWVQSSWPSPVFVKQFTHVQQKPCHVESSIKPHTRLLDTT